MKKEKIVISRQQAVDDILDRVNDWDIDTLLNYVNHHYGEYLKSCSISNLEQEYMSEFDIMDSDDEELQILDTKATKLLFDKKV